MGFSKIFAQFSDFYTSWDSKKKKFLEHQELLETHIYGEKIRVLTYTRLMQLIEHDIMDYFNVKIYPKAIRKKCRTVLVRHWISEWIGKAKSGFNLNSIYSLINISVRERRRI